VTAVQTESVRDVAAIAAIFGFFGSVWLGWAQERPPRSWRRWLLAGSIVSVLTAIAGGLVIWSHRAGSTAFDRDTSIGFGVVVGIEVLLAGAGAAVLSARGRKETIPVWIAFVVGVHLFPVAALVGFPLIYVVAALVTIAAVAATPVARRRSLPLSAVVGLGAGTALLAGALVALLIAL